MKTETATGLKADRNATIIWIFETSGEAGGSGGGQEGHTKKLKQCTRAYPMWLVPLSAGVLASLPPTLKGI